MGYCPDCYPAVHTITSQMILRIVLYFIVLYNSFSAVLLELDINLKIYFIHT